MRDETRANFMAFTAPLEGVVPWMYLDVRGLVTVAVGNLIDPIQYALDLPFRRPDGQLATRDEIASAWRSVKNVPALARVGYRAAARYTTLRLADEGIEIVVFRKLDEMDRALQKRFPAWESWPWQAQLGALSVAWACGPAFRFPRLEAALRSRDWTRASRECAIDPTANPGVRPRNTATVDMFTRAAATDAPTDPDIARSPAK